MPESDIADPLAILPALLTELPPGVVGLLGGMVAGLPVAVNVLVARVALLLADAKGRGGNQIIDFDCFYKNLTTDIT